ncbi:MAG: hypothetical protein QE290_19225 [Acidovorax sp.]|uniref:hypothetical protein n=1 Tax=Acidovorax sp. TaxID=1872122 RepID=UPI002613C500|nr:hypothetical protein [Acidovorax sp.]MDH4466165.1 hypothetical protein [Acidovorax sp.]
MSRTTKLILWALSALVFAVAAIWVATLYVNGDDSGAPTSLHNPYTLATTVHSASQPSEGLTNETMDKAFLSRLEQNARNSIQEKVRAKRFAAGESNSRVDLSTDSAYLRAGPIKLAVIRFSDGELSNQVFVAGVVGEEFRKVICTRDSAISISLLEGTCANEVARTFGHAVAQ